MVHKKGELISNEDLGIPYTNYVNRKIVETSKKILGINKLNDIYRLHDDYNGPEFAKKLLEYQNITVNVSEIAVAKIHESGPAVVVINYHHGALDGLIALKVISEKRKDIKILGNSLLRSITPMSDLFIEIGTIDPESNQTSEGIRQVKDHILKGGVLIVFPAGRVATLQHGLSKIHDYAWNRTTMKLIRNLNVPIVPMYIDGQNSSMFHITGKIHPLLQTAQLPLELIKKQNETVTVEIANPINTQTQALLDTIDDFSAYVRTNTYILKQKINNSNPLLFNADTPTVAPSTTSNDQLVKILNNQNIRDQIQRFRIAQSGDLSLYLLPGNELPIEFMPLTEYSEKKPYINYLMVTDDAQQNLIMFYKIVLGNGVIEGDGMVEEFHAYSQFEFSRKLNPLLKQAIEITPLHTDIDHIDKLHPFLLLWSGVTRIIEMNPWSRYLIGTVSISGNFPAASKALIINYIKRLSKTTYFTKYVIPRHGLSIRNASATSVVSHVKGISSDILIEKLLSDMAPDSLSPARQSELSIIPSLIKRYMQLGGSLVRLNIDNAEKGTMDALMILEINNKTASSTLQ